MTQKTDKTPLGRRTDKQVRDDRLKAALKANMGKRKLQARARAEKPDANGEKGD